MLNKRLGVTGFEPLPEQYFSFGDQDAIDRAMGDSYIDIDSKLHNQTALCSLIYLHAYKTDHS